MDNSKPTIVLEQNAKKGAGLHGEYLQLLNTLSVQFIMFHRICLDTGEWRLLVSDAEVEEMAEKVESWGEFLVATSDLIHPSDKEAYLSEFSMDTMRSKLNTVKHYGYEFRREMGRDEADQPIYRWYRGEIVLSTDDSSKKSKWCTVSIQDVNERHLAIEARLKMEADNSLLKKLLYMGKLLTESHRNHERLLEALHILAQMQGADWVRIYRAFWTDNGEEQLTTLGIWAKNGIKVLSFENNPDAICEMLKPYFSVLKGGRVADIADVQRDLPVSKQYMEVFENAGVRRVIWVPIIFQSGTFFGYVSVVNPENELLNQTIIEMIALYFSLACENALEQEKIEELSIYDLNTGVYNRNAYLKYASNAREKASLYSCIFIDANGLHSYNNTYGHAMGDKMLRTIAEICSQVVGPKGTVFRMGGDEFLILYGGISKMQIDSDLAEIRRRVEQHHFSVSLGTAYDGSSDDIESLVKEADKRMFEDKKEFYKREIAR